MDNTSVQSSHKYRLGLLDPPWAYDNKQQNDPKRGGITYETLSMKDLYDIPIGDAFEKDSGIIVWVTMPKLLDQYYEKYDPLNIIRHWGFRPVTVLFVWIKLKPTGKIDAIDTGATYEELVWMNDLYSGLGRYTNSNAEMAIYARKGKGIPRIEKNVKQLIFAPIGAHSAKPVEQYSRIVRLFGDIPRIELFARKQNPPPIGWHGVGYDWDGQDIRTWIKQYE